jgi:hypothetical protein
VKFGEASTLPEHPASATFLQGMTMMFLKLNMTREAPLAALRGWLRNVAMALVFSAGIFSVEHSVSAAGMMNYGEAGLSQKWGVPSALAGLLAYEGFEYPTGNSLPGQGGGIGWSNVWVDVSGNASEVVVSGLAAGVNAPMGFDARSSGNAAYVNSNSRSGRWLDCSPTGNFGLADFLDANGNIGANGKTVYISFLQQPNIANNNFYEFEFHRNDLGDPGRIGGIGCDVANSAQVYLRAPAATQTPLGVADTNVNFYVLRIDFKAGNDDVSVYRNPTGSLESDNEPVLTMLTVADMSFDGISMAAYLNGMTVSHDEIRIGKTWASVLGNPPAFVTQPTNQISYAGEDVTLISAAQSSQPLNYQWYHVWGGSTNALPGQTNANISFANVQLSDAGQYFVTASNALGMARSSTTTLTVQIISVAMIGSSYVPVAPGSNAVLSATVGGTQPLTMQWYKDGAAIFGKTSATLALGEGIFDAGQYMLVASNTYGSVTSAVVNVFPNFGGLLAYEGFNYGQSSSDIGGGDGGFGWVGAWVNVDGGSSRSYSNNLVAGPNSPAGYDVHSLAGYLLIANASRKGRFLDCSATGPFAQRGYLDSNGKIGADGTRVYFSFLQQPSSTSQFYEFEFKRGDLGDGGRIGGIGNDTGDSHAHLRIESPAGGTSTFYDLGLGSTNVNFYVVRIDYHTGNDTVTVYRNSTSPTEPATPTLTVSNVGDLSFDGISVAAYLNGVTVSHDEVRVGATWADVVGNTVSQLQFAQRINNASSLLLAGSPNYTYQILAATNVMGPWSNIGNVATPVMGVSRFAETNAIIAQRFYRALNGMPAVVPPSADMLIADFEQSNYGAWAATGTAFGSGPAQGTLANQNPVSGYLGAGLANSYYGTDSSTGTLTSPPFAITKPYLNFLIGGGNLAGQECLSLIISNVVVRTATGGNSEALNQNQWDVSPYLGQMATLQIVDSATGGWGHILVDQITLSDARLPALPSLSRMMLITNTLLNLPVKNNSTMRRVTIAVGGKPVRDFNIKLADGVPDWWAFVDVSEFQGETATVSVNSLTRGSTALASIVQTNGVVDATNLYRETLRPQLHFSSKRGWVNDANGMF